MRVCKLCETKEVLDSKKVYCEDCELMDKYIKKFMNEYPRKAVQYLENKLKAAKKSRANRFMAKSI